MAKSIKPENRLICCCFSSFCGVSTYKFNRYPPSQASTDPTSDVYIVAFSFFDLFHKSKGVCLSLVVKKAQFLSRAGYYFCNTRFIFYGLLVCPNLFNFLMDFAAILFEIEIEFSKTNSRQFETVH